MDPWRDDPDQEQNPPEEGAADNDQESHVSPSDNDGETIPEEEVVDQIGG